MSSSTYFDIMPPKDIHELTVGELLTHYSDEFKRKNGITIGTKIPVKYEVECWNCNTLFLAAPYQNYCSKRCTDIGEWKENNWDLDR